nr:MAG TPA: hypothetical protein [Caudoviricetes sp.]
MTSGSAPTRPPEIPLRCWHSSTPMGGRPSGMISSGSWPCSSAMGRH